LTALTNLRPKLVSITEDKKMVLLTSHASLNSPSKTTLRMTTRLMVITNLSLDQECILMSSILSLRLFLARPIPSLSAHLTPTLKKSSRRLLWKSLLKSSHTSISRLDSRLQEHSPTMLEKKSSDSSTLRVAIRFMLIQKPEEDGTSRLFSSCLTL